MIGGGILLGCSGFGSLPGGGAAEPASTGRPPIAAPPTAALPTAALPAVPGKDYLLLERRRFLDTVGFEQPIEAFSLLLPKDWRSEGGVRWLGVQACRGDIISQYLHATSADGQMQLDVYPSRTFVWADDQMMFQLFQRMAQQGGCAMNQSFDAAQYVTGFAQHDLGAQASEVVVDEASTGTLRQLDEQSNTIARQYGTGGEQKSSAVRARLAWPDGTEGIADVALTQSVLRKQNMLTGGVDNSYTTSVFFCLVMRFPAARREEATKLLGMIQASDRTNPVWSEAKGRFLTDLGTREHVASMERIRLQGEQSKAYAEAQAGATAQRSREWELTSPGTDDGAHTRFVNTIREVEQYRDGAGTVELSSGYENAWSRGDGTYILSNSPSFDPSSTFQDPAWKQMPLAAP